MKCLILLSVIMSITAIGCTSENVYICTGPQSEVYHKKVNVEDFQSAVVR